MADLEASDLEALQGYWNMISVEVDGQEFPPGNSAIEVDGNRFVSLGMGGQFEGTVDLNEGATPKTFDLHFDKGPHTGSTALGIYELNGDDWKLCMGLTGKSRPARFVTAKGTGHALETLRRGPKPAAAAPTAVTGDPTELEGEWRMTSCIQNGKPLAKNYVGYTRRIFAGDRTTLYIGDQISAQSRFSLNAPEIDYDDLGRQGIYERTGNVLRISMAERGAPRSLDFEAVKGDRRTVTQWKFRSPAE
jgi:uncharacterized protein (TIGR03067 family)